MRSIASVTIWFFAGLAILDTLNINLTTLVAPASILGVALGFGATFFNAAQDSLAEHCRLSFSRGVRITPARLGDRGPLIGAGAVGMRGLHRNTRSAAGASS